MADEEPKFVIEMLKKMMENAATDPLAALTNLNGAMDLAVRFLPTLPNEFPFPIPRGIYEKLKEMQKK